MDFLLTGLLLAAGVVIGVVSVTVGSSALFTIPLLLSLGLGPVAAVATNKFAVLGSLTSGGIKYHSKGIFKSKKLLALLCAASVAGSLLGAKIALSIDQQTLKIVIAALLIVGLTLFLFQQKKAGKSKRLPGGEIIGAAVFFFLGIYSGIIGAGLGSLIIIALA